MRIPGNPERLSAVLDHKLTKFFIKNGKKENSRTAVKNGERILKQWRKGVNYHERVYEGTQKEFSPQGWKIKPGILLHKKNKFISDKDFSAVMEFNH